MAKPKKGRSKEVKRGLLARPLDALVFLLPLLFFYQYASLTRPQNRVIADHLLQRFFELFGQAGMWAPGFGVIFILLATHAASGEKWKVRWLGVIGMYGETAILAIPLLAMNWAFPMVGGLTEAAPLLDRIAMGMGAGIYEELVFRLILISVIVMIGTDLLRLDPTGTAIVAIILSSVAFAAHHHRPIGMEPFHPGVFCFRTLAGAYLASIFWYRGYGAAAGCHASYNVALVVISTDVV